MIHLLIPAELGDVVDRQDAAALRVADDGDLLGPGVGQHTIDDEPQRPGGIADIARELGGGDGAPYTQ